MPALTGGQALVQQLKREGVETIFALPGVQLDWAFDALYDEQACIRVVHTRHEQATSYMADGYARASGRPGVCLVVPGPGVLNAGAGLATAYACSSPVLCIVGQIDSSLIGVGRGALHEINNQLETVRSVAKWGARAARPEQVAGTVHEAFRQLLSGRGRPVVIEIPPDILQGMGETPLHEAAPAAAGEEGDPEMVDAAARALGQAQRPLIFAGGGVIRGAAWDELRRLAELLEAPVIMSSNGRGALSDRHHLAQVAGAGAELTPKADVVLAVGTRFVQPATAPWQVTRHQTVIQMDVDPEEIGRNYPPNIRIGADAKAGLAALAQRTEQYNRKRESRRSELETVKAEVRAQFDNDEHRAPLAHAIRAELPEDGIFISESTQVGYWCNAGGFPVYQPRTFFTPGYQGTLGYGFPTALGAQVAHPGKKVVSINGDGGFMYNVQELATMVLHHISAVAIVFNDNAYGNVKRIQQTTFEGRTIASDLLNPDFLKLADAFGVQGLRAHGADELRGCLREALQGNAPTLIEVPVGPMPAWRFPR